MKKLLVLFAIQLSLTAHAKTACDDFAPYGVPQPKFDTQPLCRTSYMELHNNDAKTGGIAIEHLTQTTIGTGNEPRTNNFRPDIEVPANSRSYPKDYEGTGFDKGHLAPAGDMKEDGQSMSQSFFMSNMAPQWPNHNRGIWRGLERLVHGWVIGGRDLYVMTGTVYQNAPTCLKDVTPCTAKTGVWIPDSFYKVIIDKQGLDAVAYLIPNQQGQFNKISSYRMTLSELQKLIGIDLIPDALMTEKYTISTNKGNTFPSK